MAIRRLIEVFLNQFDEKVQIVSLGAGSDTNAFWVLKNFAHAKIFELDFFNVVHNKLQVIKREWSAALSFMSNGKTFPVEGEIWSSDRLSLISCNLRCSEDIKNGWGGQGG